MPMNRVVVVTKMFYGWLRSIKIKEHFFHIKHIFISICKNMFLPNNVTKITMDIKLR